MFESMHMHTPVVVVLLAITMALVVMGLFIALRVAGHRAVKAEVAPTVPPRGKEPA